MSEAADQKDGAHEGDIKELRPKSIPHRIPPRVHLPPEDLDEAAIINALELLIQKGAIDNALIGRFQEGAVFAALHARILDEAFDKALNTRVEALFEESVKAQLSELMEKVAEVDAKLDQKQRNGVEEIEDVGACFAVGEDDAGWVLDRHSSRQTGPSQMDGKVSEVGKCQSHLHSERLKTDHIEIYRFKESTWDIAIFIGSEAFCAGESCMLAFLLFINVVVQVVFVGVAYFNFMESEVDDGLISSVRQWRTYTAHDMRNFDPLSNYSLASRVCGSDGSLSVSDGQRSLYERISEYLNPNATGLEAMMNGVSLCLVALLVWLLFVSKEVHRALDLQRGLVNLARGPMKAEIQKSKIVGVTYRLTHISIGRIIFTQAIMVYRMTAAIILCICGISFLAYTVDITELVLNAIALDIVLNIDDALFDALATVNARHLLIRLEPLKMPRWPQRHGIDVKSFVMAVLIPVILIAIMFGVLLPMVSDLKDIMFEICGGNTDFIFAEDARRMVVMSPSAPYTGYSDAKQSPFELSIREAISQHNDDKRDTSQYALWINSPQDLRTHTNLNFEDTIVSKHTCVDMATGPYLAYLRHIHENNSITTCADVKQWCASPSFPPNWLPDGKGLMTRMLCPETCECWNLQSQRFTTTGCPPDCTFDANPAYYRQRNQTVCENLPNTSRIWRAWANQMRAYSMVFEFPKAVEIADALETDGCEFLDYNKKFQVYPCWNWGRPNLPYSTMTQVCPQKCCSSSDGPVSCPTSCA